MLVTKKIVDVVRNVGFESRLPEVIIVVHVHRPFVVEPVVKRVAFECQGDSDG